MKRIANFLIAVLFLSIQANAQKVKNTSGDADVLKSESSINIKFTYDNISVNKYKVEQE